MGVVQAGWPFASIITAFASVHFLATAGWAALFVAIGLLGAGLMVVAAALLPEAPAFLAADTGARAAARLGRVRAGMGLDPLAPTDPVAAAAAVPRSTRQAVAALFAPPLARNSVLLWSAVTLGYFDLYFVIS